MHTSLKFRPHVDALTNGKNKKKWLSSNHLTRNITCKISCRSRASDLPFPFMGFTSLLLEETLLGVVETVAVGVPGLTSLLLPVVPPGFPDTAEPPPVCFPPPDSFLTTCCWPLTVTLSPGDDVLAPLPPVEDVWDAFCCANLSCLRNLARRFWNQTCRIAWQIQIKNSGHFVFRLHVHKGADPTQLKTRKSKWFLCLSKY